MIYIIIFILLGCSVYKGFEWKNKFVHVKQQKPLEFIRQDDKGKDVRMVVDEKEVTFFTADGEISFKVDEQQRRKVLESVQ